MKQKIHNVLQLVSGNPLVSGSAIIFFGLNTSNVLNLLSNLFMSRNLSPKDYGTYISLVSLITLASYPVSAVTPTIVRFAAVYFANNDNDSLRGFFIKITKVASLIGIVLLCVFLLFTPSIGKFFNIENQFVIKISAFVIFITYIGLANTTYLQAKLAFFFISISTFIGALLKLSVGVLLVIMGYAVGGALTAFLVSVIVPYLLSFIPLNFLFKKSMKTPHVSNTELFTYGLPSAIALFGLTSFVSTDILLVKHFFSANSAGAYSVLSLLARIIYFLTAPISTVMFPLIVQKHARNENYHLDFKLALSLVILPSVVISIAYFITPNLIISLLTKSAYESVAPMLGWFGIFISIYSILSILTNFFLSIKKTQIYIPIGIAALLQAILIWFIHDTFYHIITISIGISALLLILLLLYYWHLYGKKRTV